MARYAGVDHEDKKAAILKMFHGADEWVTESRTTVRRPNLGQFGPAESLYEVHKYLNCGASEPTTAVGYTG
jgi:hypothetical protein